MQTPLIYTTEGNLPVAELEYSTRWEDSAEATKFIETYKKDGVVVRESAHVLTRTSLGTLMAQEAFS